MNETKPYSLRKLEARDIFAMSRILNAIGIKEFKRCLRPEQLKAFADNETELNVEAIGVEIVFDAAGILLENLPECEDLLYAFLSSLSGLKKEEIKALGMAEFTEMVVDVIKKEEFRDFIKVVSKLPK